MVPNGGGVKAGRPSQILALPGVRASAPPEAKAVSPLRSATAVQKRGRLLTRHAGARALGGYRRVHNQPFQKPWSCSETLPSTVFIIVLSSSAVKMMSMLL